MDEVKQSIAAEVKKAVKTIGRLPGVSTNDVTELQTMIRVQLAEGMPRYFLVKVSEQM